MTSKIIANPNPISTLGWMIVAASKCSLIESELFQVLLIKIYLTRLKTNPPFYKKILVAIWQVISVLLWVIVILVILSSVGRDLAFGAPSTLDAILSLQVDVENSNPFYQIQANNSIVSDLDIALVASRKTALNVASDELDSWIIDLMKRVDNPESDNDFLDWYFDYWTQQKFGLDAITTWGIRRFNQNSPTAKERVQTTVIQEFTNKVLRPELAKLELKIIAEDVAKVYTDELQQNLEKVRVRYDIPTANWDLYLQSLTVSVTDFNGRQVPLDLKAFTVGSIGGSVVLTQGTLLAIEKVTATIGVKTVAKTAAKAGGKLLGPALAIAIVAWDAIDIHNTEIQNRPELRENIEDYFKLMKADILGDGEHGIQKLISDIENSTRKSISTSWFSFFNATKIKHQIEPQQHLENGSSILPKDDVLVDGDHGIQKWILNVEDSVRKSLPIPLIPNIGDSLKKSLSTSLILDVKDRMETSLSTEWLPLFNFGETRNQLELRQVIEKVKSPFHPNWKEETQIVEEGYRPNLPESTPLASD